MTRPTLVLDPNGFDLARFGDPPQSVIAALSLRFNPFGMPGWPSTEVGGLPGRAGPVQAAFAVVGGFLLAFLAGFLIAG